MLILDVGVRDIRVAVALRLSKGIGHHRLDLLQWYVTHQVYKAINSTRPFPSRIDLVMLRLKEGKVVISDRTDS